MRSTVSTSKLFFATALIFIAGCAGGAPNSTQLLPESGGSAGQAIGGLGSPPMQIANLSYTDGSITVFRISNGRATVYGHFTPSSSGAQGLAVDNQGLIYTTVSSSSGSPCTACVEVFTPTGQLVARLPAPILPGAQNAPFLTDVSLDAQGDIYVSDYGQQAVYFYSGLHDTSAAPAIVVQNSQNAASVLAIPNGDQVFISGGCGFASVRPYTRSGFGNYQPGNCFGIGTIALIGGAADDAQDILTPVDGVPGIVSVSSPAGGRIFSTPDRLGSISGIALAGDGATAYVADHRNESVYAYARPAKGWVSHGQPKLLASYKGFKNLDIIAVSP